MTPYQVIHDLGFAIGRFVLLARQADRHGQGPFRSCSIPSFRAFLEEGAREDRHLPFSASAEIAFDVFDRFQSAMATTGQRKTADADSVFSLTWSLSVFPLLEVFLTGPAQVVVESRLFTLVTLAPAGLSAFAGRESHGYSNTMTSKTSMNGRSSSEVSADAGSSGSNVQTPQTSPKG